MTLYLDDYIDKPLILEKNEAIIVEGLNKHTTHCFPGYLYDLAYNSSCSCKKVKQTYMLYTKNIARGGVRKIKLENFFGRGNWVFDFRSITYKTLKIKVYDKL